MQLVEVGDVRSGVGDGVGGERPSEPVGQAIGLRQLHTQLALHQSRQPDAAVPDEPGGDLGVEQPRGQGAADPGEDLEVLARRVHDAQARAGEDLGQRGDVDLERVDHGDASGPRELQQGQTGVVGALAMELGVEAVDVGRGQRVDQLGEARVRVDPDVLGDGAGAHSVVVPLPGPPSVGYPASIQASVPPATLMASMPFAR